MTKSRIKFLVVCVLLAMGAVTYLSCGEGTLPPQSPSSAGMLTVTGYAQ